MAFEALPTVSTDSHVHFPSTWRNPIGKPLTNRTIKRYQLEGWYGPGVRARLQKVKDWVSSKGQVHRCVGCGSKERIEWRKFLYLPKPGFWCDICIATMRRSREQERELAARVRKQMKEFFV